MFKNTFKDKTVLVTGHTGFKGSWLSLWLKKLGANVVGASIDIPSSPSHFCAAKIESKVDHHRIDVRDSAAIESLVIATQPDFVFHLAAQALVRSSYDFPLDTIATNAMGSANMLNALRALTKPVVAVMITSDKAYENLEWVWGYRETDRLGGNDPYSASKGMAEMAIRTFVESYFNKQDCNVRVGITRAGNVIGGGDWAADRIVPDCMRAWSQMKLVQIRNPAATRPWQHVLEPLSGYLALGVELAENKRFHGQAYNFGPPANQNYSVHSLIDEMAKYWEQVRWLDVSETKNYLREAGLLKLNCDKALFDLNWLPTLRFEETVQMTVEWYKEFYVNMSPNLAEYSILQIELYADLARKRGVTWAL